MFPCACGRQLASPQALEQHSRDKKCSSTSAGSQGVSEATAVASSSAKEKNMRSFTGKNQWLLKGAGLITQSIRYNELPLSGDELPVSMSSGYELLCSYNWVNSTRPSVLVPGGAPLYKNISLPLNLKKDTGIQYIDQNTHRVPQYPFEVVFQALEVMQPNAKFDAIDILVNRNTLRKFFKFCKGSKQDSFRINVFLVGETLIVERYEKSTIQLLHGSINSGYGHSFERAVTDFSPDLKGSVGHHRVLQYNLGNLKCAVRFEVDAYVSSDPIADLAAPTTDFRDHIEPLVESLNDVDLNKNKPRTERGFVNIIPRGTNIKQERMAEMKTSSKISGTLLPQMWFGRTHFLIRGRHVKGLFTEIELDDKSESLAAWEANEENQRALKKMVVLLKRLRDTVKMTHSKSCIAVYEKDSCDPTLRIMESTMGRKPLSNYIIDKFWTARD